MKGLLRKMFSKDKETEELRKAFKILFDLIKRKMPEYDDWLEMNFRRYIK